MTITNRQYILVCFVPYDFRLQNRTPSVASNIKPNIEVTEPAMIEVLEVFE